MFSKTPNIIVDASVRAFVQNETEKPSYRIGDVVVPPTMHAGIADVMDVVRKYNIDEPYWDVPQDSRVLLPDISDTMPPDIVAKIESLLSGRRLVCVCLEIRQNQMCGCDV